MAGIGIWSGAGGLGAGLDGAVGLRDAGSRAVDVQ